MDASPDGGPAGRVARISVLQPAEIVAAQLVAFAPDAVYGLPSTLREAGAILQGGGARFRIPLIFTSGELLHAGARAAISRAFQGRVFDIYGSSETKEIAWECPAGGMHVNADVLRVEILDEDGRPLPEGAEGQIVVTSLVNHAMPLLRYRMGDRGSLLPGRCECGLAFPLLGVVTGREADMLELQGGRRVSPYALTCALERVGQVLRYQITQLGSGAGAGPRDRSSRRQPRRHGGADPRRAADGGGAIPRGRDRVRRPAGPGPARQVPGGGAARLGSARVTAGRPEIAPALSAVWRHGRAPGAELRLWQDARLRRLVSHAYESVPFYRRLFDRHRLHPRHVRGVRDLEIIPFVDKTGCAVSVPATCWQRATTPRPFSRCVPAAPPASRSRSGAPGWRTSSST